MGAHSSRDIIASWRRLFDPSGTGHLDAAARFIASGTRRSSSQKASWEFHHLGLGQMGRSPSVDFREVAGHPHEKSEMIEPRRLLRLGAATLRHCGLTTVADHGQKHCAVSYPQVRPPTGRKGPIGLRCSRPVTKRSK
jgi:hypothetical protein